MGILDRNGIRASAGTRSRTEPNPVASAIAHRSSSAISRGTGTWFAAPPRLKKPLLSGFRLWPPTSSCGALSLLAAMAARSDWSVCLRGRLGRRVGRGDAGAGRPAAPVRPALDCGGDHVAAVGVLVGVRRKVVAGPPQLGVRVVVVELPVVDAVAHDLVGARERGRRQRKQGKRARDEEMSGYSIHQERPRGSPPEQNIVPGSGALNVCDPCHKAKLRRCRPASRSCRRSRFPTATRSSVRSPTAAT